MLLLKTEGDYVSRPDGLIRHMMMVSSGRTLRGSYIVNKNVQTAKSTLINDGDGGFAP